MPVLGPALSEPVARPDSYAACQLREISSWCDSWPGGIAEALGYCRPYSQAELDAYTKCVRDIQARIGGRPSPIREQLEQQEKKNWEQEVRPGGPGEDLYYYEQNPWLASIFGPWASKKKEDLEETLKKPNEWLLLLLGAAVVLVVVTRR
jgi:hypothetical protein